LYFEKTKLKINSIFCTEEINRAIFVPKFPGTKDYIIGGKNMRGTTAVINTSILKNNYKRVKELAPGSAVMAIVKANAYGHGMIQVSKILSEAGVDYLGVAFIDEAIELRKNKIKTPILVLVPENPENASTFIKYNIEAAISSLEFARALSLEAKKAKKTARIHIYVDTGMTRDGVYPNEALYFVKKCSEMSNIKLVGICTHFSSSGSDLEFAKFQLEQFTRVLKILKGSKYKFKYVHAANSAAIANIPESGFNLVRPGLALYGYSPVKELVDIFNVKPILQLKSRIILIRGIQKGDSVGYGREFISKKDTKIGTISLGYGDGFFKTLTNKAQCIIKGKKYPIVGTVCMDECMVDVGYADVSVGDEVTLIGSQGKAEIWADELAEKLGTITYEITTALSARVPRVYV